MRPEMGVVRRGRLERRGWFVLVLAAWLAALGARSTASASGDGLRPVKDWEQLSPDEQSRALRNYQRYQRLPENGRRNLDRSYERWKSLDQGEKERVRRNYQMYRQMSPGERRQFDQRYQRWKSERRK